MNLLRGELGPTRTYSRRSWLWVGRLDPADLHDGFLTVRTVKAKSGRGKVEARGYRVQEVPCSDGGRTFLFLKVDGQPDANESDVYQVFVGDGGLLGCTCKADNCHAPCCVHKDAIPALIEAGAFGGNEIDPPAYPDPTEEELDDMAASFSAYDSGLWFPPAAPADDEPLPACFQGIGGSADRAPF